MFREAREQNKKLVFGLIHLLPMPGTPYYEEGNYEASIKKAIEDAKALENGGASGCLIQTVDKVYPTGDDSDYTRVSCMAVIANEVKKNVGKDFKIGVQLMCESGECFFYKMHGTYRNNTVTIWNNGGRST